MIKARRSFRYSPDTTLTAFFCVKLDPFRAAVAYEADKTATRCGQRAGGILRGAKQQVAVIRCRHERYSCETF